MSQYGYSDKPTQKPSQNQGDERMWAMFCHLSTLSGSFVPFGNILGPLVVWMLKKDEYALVDDQGKEALNFQISITIWALVSLVLCVVLIGFPMLIAVMIFDLVMTVIAAIQANSGVYYRYPMTIRFVT